MSASQRGPKIRPQLLVEDLVNIAAARDDDTDPVLPVARLMEMEWTHKLSRTESARVLVILATLCRTYAFQMSAERRFEISDAFTRALRDTESGCPFPVDERGVFRGVGGRA